MSLIALGWAYANTPEVLQDEEYLNAVSWMYQNNITKFNNGADFGPHRIILREHAAKFLTDFSVNILHDTIDTTKNCEFKDLRQWDPTLSNAILNSCYLNIFYGSNGKFFPIKPLTKAEAIVTLVRILDGKQVEVDQAVRRENYTIRANQIWLSKETDAATQDRTMSRYEFGLMLYRSRNLIN